MASERNENGRKGNPPSGINYSPQNKVFFPSIQFFVSFFSTSFLDVHPTFVGKIKLYKDVNAKKDDNQFYKVINSESKYQDYAILSFFHNYRVTLICGVAVFHKGLLFSEYALMSIKIRYERQFVLLIYFIEYLIKRYR